MRGRPGLPSLVVSFELGVKQIVTQPQATNGRLLHNGGERVPGQLHVDPSTKQLRSAAQNQQQQSQQSGVQGKYLGFAGRGGLGGTHRHSLEKLKEYET